MSGSYLQNDIAKQPQSYPMLNSWQRYLIRHLESLGLSRFEISFGNKASSAVTLGVIKPGIPLAKIRIVSIKALGAALGSGVLGWSEAYLKGHWETDSLIDVCNWAMANLDNIEKGFSGSLWSKLLNRIVHLRNANSREGSKRNIEYHYDLGNDFYRLWLDSSMSYSSALYDSQNISLREAQVNKYREVIRMANIRPHDRILEIGCGWGGFAEEVMSVLGTELHGVTLSKEQLQWAKERMSRLRESDRTRLELKDYRDLDGQYDAIVSIEMFEAVGEEHWPGYFEVLREKLKPGASAVLQVICINEDRFEHYRKNTDFIQKYIFPGGMLPSPSKVRELAESSGLELHSEKEFGTDYAKTLELWRLSFQRAWPELQAQGFDARFKRMWEYYLCYCEAGFNYKSVDVRLFELKKPESV
ncbi:SAM-dependent methyltransferase [Pseudoteredinibacter isoporae]|uniref:Cyclopropane-fatty-acyl-phospholipid synthase n=1 Tax=Pseudoteredinibacter isoporae TaxID=570281 RepID=A0A7X0JQ08_9GAMM|nr:cyclopropane-fatty-acyl-phospholipid synthase family protein [Pseudoteredinibacter isoporae]MBB6520087.1 cyclopropane-fatty-acyl-phospholipid synthase [Pseudoteredinibacter isoporae]NHO85659.1 class I SAM-dependent methyltransferase [Pseudoteredinibacter isoporae]NIB25889.1 class I SAM-dependent methyltransferase [Pseudoteredinibacter isoporae]